METKLKTRLFARPSQLWSGALAGVSLAAVACGGTELEQRDLGNTTAADSTERTSLVQGDGSLDSFVYGHWLGEAEDLFSPPGPDGTRPPYTFPSGSQQITLNLPLPEPGYMFGGGITFGEGPVPDPAAGVAYPPGITSQSGDLATIPPLEGFAYGVQETNRAVNGALAVGYNAPDPYTDWCRLQPTRSDGYGNFDCITQVAPPDDAAASGLCNDRPQVKDPASGITFTQDFFHDCVVGWLCRTPAQGGAGACQCSKQACTVAYSAAPVQLWLMRSGEDLVGNFVRAVFDYGAQADLSGGDQTYLPVGNVRFKRQAP